MSTAPLDCYCCSLQPVTLLPTFPAAMPKAGEFSSSGSRLQHLTDNMLPCVLLLYLSAQSGVQIEEQEYPVLIDALATVFSPYGQLEKMAIFEKNGVWQVNT